jgi:hypothetical protein
MALLQLGGEGDRKPGFVPPAIRINAYFKKIGMHARRVAYEGIDPRERRRSFQVRAE